MGKKKKQKSTERHAYGITVLKSADARVRDGSKDKTGYLAKKYGAKVVGLDADPAVFPYLDLHAKINGVKIKTQEATFEQL